MATTTITKTASANITLTAGQWLVVSGDGTYTLGPGLYNGKIVGIVNGAKIGPFPFDQTVVLCASVTDLVYYTQSAPIGTYQMSLDPASGLITDPAQRAAVGEVAGVKTAVGLVATRCASMSAFASSNKQTMSRSAHIATEDIRSLQVVYANWYCAVNNGEQAPGASANVQASIEYPAGTITPLTFGGSATGVMADGGNVVSDACAVTIPRGATFWVRSFQDATAGIVYNGSYASNELGEWTTFGATTTSYVNSATNVSNTQAGVCYRPAAIIGYRTRDAFGLIGDSRLGNGTNYDNRNNAWGAIGEVERSVVKLGATANYGCAGERAVGAAGTQADRRIALIKAYCNRVIVNYGINDAIAGTAAATIASALVTLANKIGLPAYHCTVAPKSASTDSWATTGNQTTDATANPIRVSLNALSRNGLGAPYIGSIEVADQVESARDSGLWKATGSANGYTADGLHGNAAGNRLIEYSPAFVQAVRL